MPDEIRIGLPVGRVGGTRLPEPTVVTSRGRRPEQPVFDRVTHDSKWPWLSRLIRKRLRGDHITGLELGKDQAQLFRVHLDAYAKEPKAKLVKMAARKFKCHKSAIRSAGGAPFDLWVARVDRS